MILEKKTGEKYKNCTKKREKIVYIYHKKIMTKG